MWIFGIKSFQVVGRYKMTGETGSYRYMAPEVFKSELCKDLLNCNR